MSQGVESGSDELRGRVPGAVGGDPDGPVEQSGGRTTGLVRYLAGPGKQNEPVRPRRHSRPRTG